VNGRAPIHRAHPVVAVLPLVHDRPDCPPECRTGALCASCQIEVRAEALEWLRELNGPPEPGMRLIDLANPNGWRWGDRPADRSTPQS
jgi:hypothetical protein